MENLEIFTIQQKYNEFKNTLQQSIEKNTSNINNTFFLDLIEEYISDIKCWNCNKLFHELNIKKIVDTKGEIKTICIQCFVNKKNIQKEKK